MTTPSKFDTGRPVKRSFSIKGHRTSISLEETFWDAFKDAADREGLTLAGLVTKIDAERGEGGLSTAVRIWVLNYFRRSHLKANYDGGNRD
jgi:predicted DNA-binding ribbon-helix-helix protein